MIEKLLKWSIFTVVLSLFPFAAVILGDALHHRAIEPQTLWMHGDLLLVSMAIGADGVSEFIGLRAAGSGIAAVGYYSKIICILACLLISLLSAVGYGIIQGDPGGVAPDVISVVSLRAFYGSVLAGCSCKVLA
jgi:hypothetical protein